MNKSIKIVLAIVLMVIVIIFCCKIGGKKEEVSNEISNNTVEGNSIDANEIDTDIVENEVENEVEEEPIIENITKVEPQGTVYENNSDVGTTDKKQQAINLVKDTWGEDDSVTFRCDSVNAKGEYVIAVVSKETASVKNYFKVNLNTKTVEIDY